MACVENDSQEVQSRSGPNHLVILEQKAHVLVKQLRLSVHQVEQEYNNIIEKGREK